MSLINNSYYFT